MTLKPAPSFFKFALSPDEPSLTPSCDLWSAALPNSRHAFTLSDDGDASGQTMTHGDYFTAAEQFLSQDNFGLLCEAAGQISGRPLKPDEIESISIYLVKFGAFYHPSYVVVAAAGRQIPFVLNVAVSPEGREIIAREYQNLARLNQALETSYWPRVFGLGQGEEAAGHRIPMFLGEWFDGFYEFHLSGEDPAQRHVVVWDTDHGHRKLRADQVLGCLEQAACILTQAYHPLTFESIGHWHHAAGDFVIALDDDAVSLRMITVRNYAPMIENDQPDVAEILEALLVFFLRISLRLRLDRLDGIGRMVCHNDTVVPAICRGFFRGVKMAAPHHGLPEDFDAVVQEYMALHSADQLMSLASDIIERQPFNADEQDLLRRILASHSSTLISAVSN